MQCIKLHLPSGSSFCNALNYICQFTWITNTKLFPKIYLPKGLCQSKYYFFTLFFHSKCLFGVNIHQTHDPLLTSFLNLSFFILLSLDFFCDEINFTTFRSSYVYFTAFRIMFIRLWVVIVLELFGFFLYYLQIYFFFV